MSEADLASKLAEKASCTEEFAESMLYVIATLSLEVPIGNIRIGDRFDVEYSLTELDIAENDTLDSVDTQAGKNPFLGELLFWYISETVHSDAREVFEEIEKRDSVSVLTLCAELSRLGVWEDVAK